MSDGPVDLDAHRGQDAQKATTARRHLREVVTDQDALRRRQQETEEALAAVPAATWAEAAEKARYLLQLYAETTAAMDPLRTKLIVAVLEDFERLSRAR